MRKITIHKIYLHVIKHTLFFILTVHKFKDEKVYKISRKNEEQECFSRFIAGLF
jgi:hypothetical protein